MNFPPFLNYVFLLITPMNELIGKVEVGYLSASYLLGDGLGEVISFFIGSIQSASTNLKKMRFLAPPRFYLEFLLNVH